MPGANRAVKVADPPETCSVAITRSGCPGAASAPGSVTPAVRVAGGSPIGTKGEIRGIPAALGYSDFHNLSPSDLRTSSIDASLQGNILLEGIDRTYLEIIEEVINEYVSEKGMDMNSSEIQDVLRSVVGE